MRKYTIYADLHIGRLLAIRPKFIFDKNTVFLGDNFDIKNTLRSKLDNLIKLRKETIKKCRDAKGIYITGNHSLSPLKNTDNRIAIREHILFTHGELIEWSSMRIKLFHLTSSQGKNRLFWIFQEQWRRLFPVTCSKLSKEQITRAVNLAKKYRCKTIVLAHLHPERLIKLHAGSINIVIVPQGKSIVHL
jgi:hypothetical protein